MKAVLITALALSAQISLGAVDLGGGITSSRYKTESNLNERSYPLTGYYLDASYAVNPTFKVTGTASYSEGESRYNRSTRALRLFPEFAVYGPFSLLGGLGYHNRRELSISQDAYTGLAGLSIKAMAWKDGPIFKVCALYERSLKASDYEVDGFRYEDNKFGNFEVNTGLSYSL